MLITQKRLDLLNEREKNQMNVEITDLKDENGHENGTRVKIIIIYKEN